MSAFSSNSSSNSSSPSEQSLLSTKIMENEAQITGQTSFALTLTNHLLTKFINSNAAISPISLHALLSILAFGSKGSTQDQILSFIGSKNMSQINDLVAKVFGIVLNDGSENGGPVIRSGNGAWVDSSFSLKKEFEAVLSEKFRAEAKNVDFKSKPDEARTEVNSWVENVTKGLIKDLLPPGSVKNTIRLILGNALYFKGVWENKFQSSMTKVSDFYLLDGSSIQVPYMTTWKMQFISIFNNFSVLKLPYNQGNEDSRQFSMYVFLPHEKDGIQNLSDKLHSKSASLDKYLPRWEVEVNKFMLPKFKISFGFEASEAFESLGLTLPFHGRGDLSEMVESSTMGGNIGVSWILHKSFIEVNEEGTEAAAASAAGEPEYAASAPVDFVANHPFIFLIREDRTGLLLFTGHVVNPLLFE